MLLLLLLLLLDPFSLLVLLPLLLYSLHLPLLLLLSLPVLLLLLSLFLLLPSECARRLTRDVDEEAEGGEGRRRSTEKTQAEFARVVENKELYFVEAEEGKQERRG